MLGTLNHKDLNNKDYCILDGQICNSQELKAELEHRGSRFGTGTNTEVLLHLYRQEGIDFIKKLRGEFAFVLYDSRKKLLILARDRIGKRPLYYYTDSKKIIFASEIKAILQDKSVKREIDFESLDFYLTLGYVPAPRTMFRGIYKLLPAHFMLYRNGQLKIERYWQLSYAQKQKFTLREWERVILEHLKESISLRLPETGSAGVFLSGGVDSSSIVFLIREMLKRPLKTFSVGFEDESYSELKYARKVAQSFGTEHYEFIVKPELINILPELIWQYEEPFADSSNLPTYYAAQLASRNSHIVLGGDGGDELFGGYQRYVGTNIGIFLDKCPSLFTKTIISLLGNKSEFQGKDKKSYINKVRRFLNAVSEYRSPVERYLRWNSYFYDFQKRRLYAQAQNGSSTAPLSYFKDIFSRADGRDSIDKIMYLEIMTGLHNDSLVKVGTAARANSVEVSYPFLDHKFVEFAATIPANLKLRRFGTKYIFKKMLSKYLPREVLYRKKMGFGVPVGKWFRKEMKDYIRDHLLGQQLSNRKLFKKESIEEMLKDHINGRCDYTPQLWALLNFELWCERFIDPAEVSY